MAENCNTFDRLSNHEAVKIAKDLMVELAGQARRIEIAGSIRREKTYVKDIELVIIPHHLPSLLARLDGLVVRGDMEPRTNVKGNRIGWGEKFRACVYKKLYPVDIFICDEDNFGFIYWLRTGPGDANSRVMEMLKYMASPVRARDGRLHWVDYPADYNSADDNYIPRHVIRTPEEIDVFTLFGMDYRKPALRTMEYYSVQLTSPRHLWPDKNAIDHLLMPVPGPASQAALF